MQKKEITIYDIAKELNVSPATVSRGLKDHPSISKKTCKKIKKTAQNMGYRSNALASSLRTSRSNTLGVIVPRLNSNFMSTVLAGMEKAAVEAGYHLIIMQSFESERKEIECVKLLFNHRVDGLLISTTASSDKTSHLKPFLQKKIPIVFFDRAPLHPGNFNSVTINNKEAGYKITQLLLKNGGKRLLHITGDTSLLVYNQRLEGYSKALREQEIETDNSLIWETGLGVEDGENAAHKILALKSLPEGIFVANDTCALTMIHHLQQSGIRIPTDIQVTGFNNDPFSALMNPGLTTIRYPGTEIGETAVEIMLQLLNNATGTTINKVLDFELIIRGSTQK